MSARGDRCVASQDHVVISPNHDQALTHAARAARAKGSGQSNVVTKMSFILAPLVIDSSFCGILNFVGFS